MIKSIFIIDDDITSLDITAFLVENDGYEVKRFTNGFRALDEISTVKPNLLIVDLMMPEIDGIETIKRARDNGFSGPIIAFTALDEGDIHLSAQESGCNLVLTKPCRPAVLLEHIEKLLELHS